MTLDVTFMGATVVVLSKLPSGPKLIAAGSPRAVCDTLKEIFKAGLAADGEDPAEMTEQGD